MDGNFRRPKFVKRYEYNYYDLTTPLNSIVANNARQIKDSYRFEVIIHQKHIQSIGIMHIWKLILNLFNLLIAPPE